MLTKEQLLAPKTRKVVFEGFGEVEIRKLKLFEINPHDSKKESDIAKTYRLISASLVDPELSATDVKNLEFDILEKLQGEVLDFNGMGEKSANNIEKN